MNIRQLFLKAYDIVKNENTWTQGAYARDALQKDISAPSDPNAVCWCSAGAIIKSSEDDLWVDLIIKFNRHLSIYQNIYKFNDNHTHAEVVEFWEKVGKAEGWL